MNFSVSILQFFLIQMQLPDFILATQLFLYTTFPRAHPHKPVQTARHTHKNLCRGAIIRSYSRKRGAMTIDRLLCSVAVLLGFMLPCCTYPMFQRFLSIVRRMSAPKVSPPGIYVPVPTFFVSRSSHEESTVPPLDLETQAKHTFHLAKMGSGVFCSWDLMGKLLQYLISIAKPFSVTTEKH